MSNLDKLINDIKNDERIKRIKELEAFIDNNEDLKQLLERKKTISKEMVLCKHLGLDNAYLDYQKQYKEIDDMFANYPLVCEYMDLLQDAHNDLDIMVAYLQNKINAKLN